MLWRKRILVLWHLLGTKNDLHLLWFGGLCGADGTNMEAVISTTGGAAHDWWSGRMSSLWGGASLLLLLQGRCPVFPIYEFEVLTTISNIFFPFEKSCGRDSQDSVRQCATEPNKDGPRGLPATPPGSRMEDPVGRCLKGKLRSCRAWPQRLESRRGGSYWQRWTWGVG